MTANRRIALNIVATYGRSFYALVIGLFCGRWTLAALGPVDYGLLGVVGVLIGFVTFFNGLMADAVGRFYAFSVGEAQKAGNENDGLENCRRWFNVALLIHTVLPMVLVLIGYPTGIWAIKYFLVIPPDRVDACIWVWRFSCVACFMGMVNVPFRAMYAAKQEIAELTIYGFVTTTLNACFLYYMITHPGFWLVKFSAWSCGFGAIPQILICVFAFVHFPECRIRLGYLWDTKRVKDLFIYAGGRFVCALAMMSCQQGMAIAVNKVLGPIQNAAMTIGSSVVAHASTLTSACIGALGPAITNAAGRGEDDQMRNLAYRMCKLATFATMIFAVPIILEVDNIMVLWLGDPPSNAATLCGLILGANIINHLTDGHWMAIFAKGRVTFFNACESIGFFLGFISSVVLMALGVGIASVGYGYAIAYTYAMIVKLILGHRYCKMSVLYWGRRICYPLILTVICSIGAGIWTRFVLPPTFMRILVTSMCSEMTIVGLLWLLVLDEEEKQFALAQLRMRFSRVLC